MSPQSQKQLDNNLSMRRWGVYQQFGKFIAVVVAVWIVSRYAFFAVQQLAGRTTTADVLLRVLVGLQTSRGAALALSWLLTGSAVSWGALERAGRKRLIAKHHPESRKKQLAVDPKKGSSGITITGETGPADL